jgi:UDP-N-acetylmuramyl pentapeptide phosphotransferase/UDP-N-acetylglucosamine-1-phosphate transferase
MALVGLADDVRGLPAWLRLLVQTGCAALVIAGGFSLERLPLPAPLDLPAGALAPLLTWLWLVGVTNLFNFLDGIDGYAGWQTVLACAGAALLGLGEPMTAAAICLGGAAVGLRNGVRCRARRLRGGRCRRRGLLPGRLGRFVFRLLRRLSQDDPPGT